MRERVDLSVFGAPERSWPYQHCIVCSGEAELGYRDAANELQWFCASHRRAQYWADARRCLKCLPTTSREKETTTMDARNFGSKYIGPDNVREGPLTARIVNVIEDDRYGRLML